MRFTLKNHRVCFAAVHLTDHRPIVTYKGEIYMNNEAGHTIWLERCGLCSDRIIGYVLGDIYRNSNSTQCKNAMLALQVPQHVAHF